jgi:WS/DGAT/MGAT family acyltransferase
MMDSVLDPTVDWLSAEDALILALEGPLIAGHTCKVVELAPGADRISIDALRDHVRSRLDAVPRLRRRLDPNAQPLGRPAWVEDTEFDIVRHVVELRTPRPLDEGGLHEAVAGLMGARLDRSRPLWSVHLVPELSNGGSALVLRVHHALADGSATMAIASRVLWEALPSEATAGNARPRVEAATGPHPALGADRAGPRTARNAVARRAAALRAVGRELWPASAPSPLAAHVSSQRAVARAAVPLADIRRIEKSVGMGTTVNDVILSAVGGGLRRGLFDGGRLPRLRAKVPVSMHRPDEPDGVGNRDSFICVDLDIAEPDSLRRLLAIRAGTRERKLRGDAVVLDELLHGRFRRLGAVARVAARWSMSPRVFALNVSNVRGPSEPLTVLGRPVRSVYSLAEVAQRHAVRVAALSSLGQVTFGVCADAEAVTAPDRIAAGVEAEVAELLRRAG